MPLLDVHVIENTFTPEQKRQMIERLTDAMVSVEGEKMRGVTWVKISEVRSGEWGIGGKPMTTEAVKELAARRHAHEPALTGGAAVASSVTDPASAATLNGKRAVVASWASDGCERLRRCGQS
jgi:4-oxalocrotonate tautomerase